jgi:hypothetical protein
LSERGEREGESVAAKGGGEREKERANERERERERKREREQGRERERAMERQREEGRERESLVRWAHRLLVVAAVVLVLLPPVDQWSNGRIMVKWMTSGQMDGQWTKERGCAQWTARRLGWPARPGKRLG